MPNAPTSNLMAAAGTPATSLTTMQTPSLPFGNTAMLGGTRGVQMDFRTEFANQSDVTDAEQQMTPVTVKVYLITDRVNALLHIRSGTPLMYFRTNLDVKKRKVHGVPIWVINFFMEESIRNPNMMGDSRSSHGASQPSASKARRLTYNTGSDSYLEDIDFLLHEHRKSDNAFDVGTSGDMSTFLNRYSGFGYVFHDPPRNKNNAVANTAVYGELRNVGNLWGDVHAGDVVGFVVKWIKIGYYDYYYNIDGSQAGAFTNRQFMQIVPVVYNKRFPRHDSGQPTQDLDSTAPITFKQRRYKHHDDAPELVTTDVDDTVRSTLTADVTRFGYPIHIGTVKGTNGRTPSIAERKRAMRSPEKFQDLAAKYTLTVLLGVL